MSRRPTTRIFACLLAGGLLSAAAPAADNPAAQNQQTWRDVFPKLMQLFDRVRQLGEWDQQQILVIDAIENFYRQNGWNNETDLFLKEVSIEAARVPPWQIAQRLEVVGSRIQERYGLSDEQKKSLKERIFREALVVMTRNFSTISSNADEIIRTRQAGQPFTPEQVARWVRNDRPVRMEWYRSVMELTNELGEMVPMTQKAQFQRDFENVNRRLGMMEQMYTEWEQGKWRPEDWGLHDDPMHAGLIKAEAHPPSRPPASQPAIRVTSQMSAWARYVQEFVGKYELDRSQEVTAWSILEELEERARRIQESKPAPADDGSADAKKTQADTEVIAVIFEELKARLEQLPTRSQRSRAAAAAAGS